jgi:hypothetical protein
MKLQKHLSHSSLSLLDPPRRLFKMHTSDSPADKTRKATMLKQRRMISAMTLCSMLRWPSCLSATRARRQAKVDSGQQLISNCWRSWLPRQFRCSDVRSGQRCDSLSPSCAGGCKKSVRTQRPKMGQRMAALSRRDMAWLILLTYKTRGAQFSRS